MAWKGRFLQGVEKVVFAEKYIFDPQNCEKISRFFLQNFRRFLPGVFPENLPRFFVKKIDLLARSFAGDSGRFLKIVLYKTDITKKKT